MGEINRGKTSQAGVSKELQTKTVSSPDAFVPTGHPLESDKAQETLKRLMQWRRQARIGQADNREEMAKDEDYYDGIQLDEQDLRILADRNQPALVFNVIANTVNWILGTERRARVDARVLPRKSDGAESAKAKTKLMKYTQDASKGEYERSFAFSDCVKAGLGWLETGVKSDITEEPIFVKRESWRNMWFDHLGQSWDGSDWRYQIREKWVDLDVAVAMYPDREEALKRVAESVNSMFPYLPDDTIITDPASEFDIETEMDALYGGYSSGSRQRLKMIEMWYRIPASVKIMRKRADDTPFGVFDGSIYRPELEDHKYLVDGRYFTLTDARVMTVRNAMWTGSLYLQDILTPYNHHRFPFTPIFCYRRGRDGQPYGVIRNLRDPQSDLNKRRSRSLVLLTSNRVVMEKGAVDNKQEAYEEAQRPDGVIEVNVGKKFELEDQRALASAHVELARDDERFINNISGVTPEVKGDSRRQLSGVAVERLQNQGQVTQGNYFDNLYYAIQTEGEIRLALIEQFFDEEREYRITGKQNRDEFVRINKRREDGTVENDILRSKADFVVGKQDYRETIRLSMVEMLSDLVTSLSQSMPEVALKLIDMVIDLMDDIPNKDIIVERIRKINGQMGPEDEMSDEQKAQQQEMVKQIAEQQAKNEQIQNAMLQLEMATKQADATSKMARAYKDRMDSAAKKIETFLKALETAGVLAMSPQLADAADALIQDATDSVEPADIQEDQTGV